MRTVPCAVCGYHAPEPACPHCGPAPLEPSLAAPVAGPLSGVRDGLLAMPKGLRVLLFTRGIKRWLVPPLLLTAVVLVAALAWAFSALGTALDAALPDALEFGAQEWEWLQGLAEGWSWLHTALLAVFGGLEWFVNVAWGFLTSRPLTWLTYFLVGSLITWYSFSLAYEAFAGPFLDEVQARLEHDWFGADPRSRLERPNDIPSERCVRLSLLAGAGLVLALGVLVFGGGARWLALPLAALPLFAATRLDRRYGPWLRWVIRVEARAAWASLQATFVTLVMIVLALPLYFVPFAGYFLFAGVCGFATAVGLLDIPFERRGWALGQRLRFLGRNLPAMLAFGVAAGVLLAIPIVGPVLMVPSASIGGLWLLCRLDKAHLRPGDGAGAAR
jgi:uncharacterized protein involved in cysteine biosynthesis